MTDVLYEVSIIFVLILVNGLFAMSEIALVSARKARLQPRADDGDPGAMAALRLAANPNRLLSTAQVGISLVGVLSGAVGGATLSHHLAPVIARAAWLAPYSDAIALVMVVAGITYFSLVLGELVPKRLALTDPEAYAMRSARFMEWLARVTSPVVSLLSKSTDIGLRIIGAPAHRDSGVTEEEVKVLLEQGTQRGVFEEAEQNMVESVFRLSDRRVDMLMTPRTDVVWLDLDEPTEEILRKVSEHNFSRYPVAQGSLDNILGILVVREMLAEAVAKQPINIRELLHPVIFAPESMPALKVLELLKNGGIHSALVIDEYGGVLGLVTLFDILEAIIGEISATPGESFEPLVTRRADGSLLLDGRLRVDELKELLDLDSLPDEERVGYQTLGGLVMSQFGEIPVSGQFFDWENLRFEVVDMDGHRVDKVLVQAASIPLMESDAADEPAGENPAKSARRAGIQKKIGSAARRDAQQESPREGGSAKNARKENG